MTLARAVVLLVVPFLLWASGAVAQSDTEPPVLVDFDFDPKTVDVTSGSADVTCELALVDSPAGVQSVGCSFQNPSSTRGESCLGGLISGSPTDGTFGCTITIPQYSEEGTWVVSHINAQDTIGNSAGWSAYNLEQLGFPTDLFVVSGSSDTEPPVLTDFDFDPKTVDVTSGSADVTCELALVDSPAGVQSVGCSFQNPSSTRGESCLGGLISGSPTDGTFGCTITIPQYSEEGTWVVSHINAQDTIGNSAGWSAYNLEQLGFPTDLFVVSGSSDTEPPVLTDFDFDPKTVDVTSGSADVTCELALVDSPAGVQSVGCSFQNPSSTRGESCLGGLISGSPTDGTFGCTITIPQYSEEGTWVVSHINAQDTIGNTAGWSAYNLEQLGFPVTFIAGFVTGELRAVIAVPQHGRRIRGDSVTIRARLVQGSPDDVHPGLGVRFDHRSLPFGDFSPIPARNPNHPNPDTTYPYFIHWDVSGMADGDYELRAVAHNLEGVADPSPEVITITIDHAGPVDVDENENAEGLQENHTAVDDAVENEAGSGDHTDTSTATDLTIPAGALSNPTDTVVLLYPDPVLEEPMLEQPEQNLGSFVDVTLESGQTDFEGGATSNLDISYSDRDQDGVVDGTSVREDEIELRYYDPGSDSYVLASGWIVMTEHNMVHADAGSTGRFALTGPLQPKCWFEADKITLAWGVVSAATSYNVYRGALADLVDVDEDGLPDNGYGDCQNHLDPDTTDTGFVDDEVPASAGTGFFYVVSFEGDDGESTLGNTSTGLGREVFSPCP